MPLENEIELEQTKEQPTNFPLPDSVKKINELMYIIQNNP
jgi:hypothetical protein